MHRSRSAPVARPGVPSAPAPAELARGGWWILAALLLVLAYRLTITEVVRESMTISAVAEAPAIPQPGAGTTVGLALLTLTLTAVAVVTLRQIGRSAWLRLALIFAILGCLNASTFAAGNRYAALVGACDVGMALLAGWTVSLLCVDARRKLLVFALLLGVLAAWGVKGLYQRYVEIPDTIAYFKEHRAEMMKARNWHEGDSSLVLFESRMNSKEVTGFITYGNNLAEALIGLTLLAGATAWACARVKTPTASAAPPAAANPKNPPAPEELPLPKLLAVGAGLLTLLGIGQLVLTESKGAGAAAFLGGAALLGWLLTRDFCRRHRTQLLLAIGVTLVLGTVAVISYGVKHDALPSRSLLFRWHYWTASVPLIREHAWTGVGLHNYGSWYTAIKRPSAPEDVKDPHGLFVRLASEAGLPATLLVAALLLWAFLAAVPRAAAEAERPLLQTEQRPLALGLTAACVAAWWLVRLFSADLPGDVFSVFMTTLYALAAYAGVALVLLAGTVLRERDARILAAGTVIGAAGMLLYDQINMALVTGPVAMLFWMMLGACDARTVVSEVSDERGAAGLRWGLAGVLLAAGAGLAIQSWLPILDGQHPWDPDAPMTQFRQALQAKNPAAASAALDAALQRDPRSVELLRTRAWLKMETQQDPRSDVLRIFALDRANIRLRIEYAGMPKSGLQREERIAAVERALWLDEQLEAGEPKHLSSAEKQRAEGLLQALKSGQ